MNTKEFIEKLDKDEELQKNFKDVTTPEKFYEVAKENGLTDDIETMKTTASEIMKAKEVNGEVDLSKLNEISGGESVAEDVGLTVASSASISLGVYTVYVATGSAAMAAV